MNGAIVYRGEVEKCVPVTDRGERRGFMMVRLALGALLFVAAGFKLFDSSPALMSDFGLLSSPHWHVAVIEGEALLGLWLLTGALPRLLWLVGGACGLHWSGRH